MNTGAHHPPMCPWESGGGAWQEPVFVIEGTPERHATRCTCAARAALVAKRAGGLESKNDDNGTHSNENGGRLCL